MPRVWLRAERWRAAAKRQCSARQQLSAACEHPCKWNLHRSYNTLRAGVRACSSAAGLYTCPATTAAKKGHPTGLAWLRDSLLTLQSCATSKLLVPHVPSETVARPLGGLACRCCALFRQPYCPVSSCTRSSSALLLAQAGLQSMRRCGLRPATAWEAGAHLQPTFSLFNHPALSTWPSTDKRPHCCFVKSLVCCKQHARSSFAYACAGGLRTRAVSLLGQLPRAQSAT